MTTMHHAASRAVAMHDLSISGNRPGVLSAGPSALGLWACEHIKNWQQNYGPVLNLITLRADARILDTNTAAMCDRAGSPDGKAWAALCLDLIAQGYQVVRMSSDDDQNTEFAILDPASIESIDVIDWPDGI